MMKYMKILIIAVLSLLIVTACQKESIIENNAPETSTQQKVDNKDGIVYIYKGKAVSKTSVNWESETLNIVHGFTKENEVLLFDNDEALIAWAKTVEGGELFINTLNNVAEALAMAEKMGEFERLERTGKVSEEYEIYLAGFVQSANRGVTKLYEHNDYLGSSKTIWVPTSYVGSSFNNKTSSIQFATIGGFLANWKWWNGSKKWYTTLAYGYFPSLGGFNDKTTSVWIY